MHCPTFFPLFCTFSRSGQEYPSFVNPPFFSTDVPLVALDLFPSLAINTKRAYVGDIYDEQLSFLLFFIADCPIN